jgi:hypothetical protein
MVVGRALGFVGEGGVDARELGVDVGALLAARAARLGALDGGR